jgi:hypothetical protein
MTSLKTRNFANFISVFLLVPLAAHASDEQPILLEEFGVLIEETLIQQLKNIQNIIQQMRYHWYFAYVDIDKEINCLARNIYFESKGEPYDGQLAVGLVTINRVKTAGFPTTICAVVWQKHQFSWTRDGRSDKPQHPDMWNQAQEIARLLLGSKTLDAVEDITMGATHFHATYIKPRWGKRLERTIRIGNHIFYRQRNNFPNLQVVVAQTT